MPHLSPQSLHYGFHEGIRSSPDFQQTLGLAAICETVEPYMVDGDLDPVYPDETSMFDPWGRDVPEERGHIRYLTRTSYFNALYFPPIDKKVLK